LGGRCERHTNEVASGACGCGLVRYLAGRNAIAVSINSIEEITLQRRLVGEKRLRYSLDFCRYYHTWYNATILTMFPSRPGQRVLDCGCGTGFLLPALEQRFDTVIGLDLSCENLLEARALIDPRTALLVGDVSRLPLQPHVFDRIVCRAVLHCLPDIMPAFRGLFEMLKPGGELVITEPIGDSPLIRAIQIIVNRRAHRRYKARQWKYTSCDWIHSAQAAGFTLISRSNVGYLALPLLGYPDGSHLMRYLPGRMLFAKWLLYLDRFISTVPLLNQHSWHAMFHFKRPDN